MIVSGREEFVHLFEKTCDKYGEKVAISYLKNDDSELSLTFGEIYRSTQSCKEQFAQTGLCAGDRVAVVAPPSPYSALALIALAYANITSVLIDTKLPIEEINRLLLHSDVRAVFTMPDIYKVLSPASISDIPVFDLSSKRFGDEIFTLSSVRVMRQATLDPATEVLSILFSSGTTSEMKGIEITYDATLQAIQIIMEVARISDTGYFLHMLPLCHIAGFNAFFTFFMVGGSVGMIEDVDAGKLKKGLTRYNPTHFLIVPRVYEIMMQRILQEASKQGVLASTIFKSMLAFSGFLRKHFGIQFGRHFFKSIRKRVFGKNLRMLGTGGSFCHESIANFYLGLGIEIWANFYALTEANTLAVATTVFDRYPAGTEGNAHRNKNISVKICNPDENGLGDIRAKTTMIMKGYFRDPELTAAAFDEDGYFKTGDLGYIDKKGYLHVTGRIKEAIHMQTGKKVSPSDVEVLYNTLFPDAPMAVCGIPSKDNPVFDEIHLFIENSEVDALQSAEIRQTLMRFSSQAGTLYKLSGVHFVEKLPVTSIGKVKRYLLKEIAMSKCEETPERKNATPVPPSNNRLEDEILRIVTAHAENQIVGLDSCLQFDLGFDSLNMLEICVEIEDRLSVHVAENLGKAETVNDLVKLVKRESRQDEALFDAEKYPLPKTNRHLRRLRLYMRLSQFFWRFEVKGRENLPADGHYILCPNHQSLFDSLWVWAAIGHKHVDLRKICCLAAEMFLSSEFEMTMLGGIPVNRNGNTVPAMKRAFECIQNGYTMLIHPEGTRTRDGRVHEFKKGAAKLAIDAGVPLIPVRIDGAWDIFPPQRKRPKVFRLGRRYPIEIAFGMPINPQGKSVDELTTQVQNEVERLGKRKGKM